ncbi:MAG: long-chain fatty acid--CoA ligase [Acidobacteriota bacterium]|nr:long-chain fatty acid--CoA ligase [Blastocatellia bacterium]MDW8412853.1 long-chain fatty acid--CoA ligase [Acidobacteriota bacterium]
MTTPAYEIKTIPGKPTTLVELLHDSAAKRDRQDAFKYKHEGVWKTCSYGEMLKRARQIALGLHSLGVRKGDRVAILSENRIEWIAADLGILCLGAANVPLYSTLTEKQVAYIVNDCGATVAFVSTEAQLKKLLAVQTELPLLKKVVVFDGYDPTAIKEQEKLMSLANLEEIGKALEREQPQLFEQANKAIKPQDLATLIYTSGTTGEPKGVILTHWNIVSDVLYTAETFEGTWNSDEEQALSFLPFSHVFERVVLYFYIHKGIPICLAESIDAVANNLLEIRPTLMTSVPRMFEKIMAKITEQGMTAGFPKANIVRWAVDVGRKWARLTHTKKAVPFLLSLQYKLAQKLFFQKIRDKVGGRIRFFLSGGAPLAEDIAYFFLAAGIPILQGYGLSETSAVVSANTPTANRVGSVGKPIKNVEVKIAEDGEILTRGTHVFQGYFNKPQETAAAFDGDWFKTGDIGHLDEDGFLYITDRKKELLKTSGGKYLAPQPIESKLKSSIYIAQAMLVGDNRKFPSALIVPNWEAFCNYAKSRGITGSREELCKNEQLRAMMLKEVQTLTSDLAKYEQIKKIALIPQEFSIENGQLTPTMKLKRRVIEQHYKELIDEMYQETGG